MVEESRQPPRKFLFSCLDVKSAFPRERSSVMASFIFCRFVSFLFTFFFVPLCCHGVFKTRIHNYGINFNHRSFCVENGTAQKNNFSLHSSTIKETEKEQSFFCQSSPFCHLFLRTSRQQLEVRRAKKQAIRLHHATYWIENMLQKQLLELYTTRTFQD